MLIYSRELLREKMIDAGILVVVMVFIGIYFPWWALAVPAGIYGFIRFERPRAVGLATLIAAVAWLAPALVQDFETGFRISSRMAKLLTLPSPVFFYGLTLFTAALLGALGSSLGAHARLATVRLTRPRP